MSLSTLNYVTNLLRLALHDRLLCPLSASYFVTTGCNLGCVYCENPRHGLHGDLVPLDQVLRILRVVRGDVDRLILTGGEPLLHPEIDGLVHAARQDLGFRHLTLITNGLLLSENEEVLPALDLLVVSLDSVDPEVWHPVLGVDQAAAQTILDSIVVCAGLQRELGYRMVANCVLTPETLPGAGKVLEFAIEHGMLVSFSPQTVNNWPRYDLLVSAEYRAFLAEMLAAKRRGAPIAGSESYLRTLGSLVPFSCYPTLIPSVMPNGDLIYPCRPIERAGSAHGGRLSNLLVTGSLNAALKVAQTDLGPPPRVCTSCFQQCFMEPSLMQARPLSLVYELLRYPACQQARLTSYAPG
jgi:MoaA/NifB/PqqE/SkfB family radical SAM enzyme